MPPRPPHLTSANVARYTDPSLVQRYGLRPPHAPHTFDVLAQLITDSPATLLDIGTGTGEIARPMSRRVAQVEALDLSQPMLNQGKTLPDGDNPNIVWRQGRAEDVTLNPPYALITAGDSLHWMAWGIVLPRLRPALTKHGFLALVHRQVLPPPWQAELQALIATYATYTPNQTFDFIMLLTERGLFEKIGDWQSEVGVVEQSVDDYIAYLHSQSYLSLDQMGVTAAMFDNELRRRIAPYSDESLHLRLQTQTEVIWGRPQSG